MQIFFFRYKKNMHVNGCFDLNKSNWIFIWVGYFVLPLFSFLFSQHLVLTRFHFSPFVSVIRGMLTTMGICVDFNPCWIENFPLKSIKTLNNKTRRRMPYGARIHICLDTHTLNKQHVSFSVRGLLLLLNAVAAAAANIE